MTENEIAKQVRQLLDIYMAQGRLYYHVSASSPMIGREGAYRKGQVDIAGWYFCKWFAFPFAWELKGPRGKVSPAQQLDLDTAHEAGAQAMVIRNLDDAIEALRELGLEGIEVAK